MTKETIIENYFQAWVNNDIEVVKQTFSNDAVYTECYGPEYHGLEQILQWFTDWNQVGHVLEWTIKRFTIEGDILAAEWYFKCDYNHSIDGFDGVTIAEFDQNQKVCRLSEYQSKAEHCFPYGK